MSLHIVLLKTPTTRSDFKLALTEHSGTVVPLSDTAFLYQADISPAELLKVLKRFYRKQPITIFNPPTTAWDTTIEADEFRNWVQNGINGETTVREVQP